MGVGTRTRVWTPTPHRWLAMTTLVLIFANGSAGFFMPVGSTSLPPDVLRDSFGPRIKVPPRQTVQELKAEKANTLLSNPTVLRQFEEARRIATMGLNDDTNGPTLEDRLESLLQTDSLPEIDEINGQATAEDRSRLTAQLQARAAQEARREDDINGTKMDVGRQMQRDTRQETALKGMLGKVTGAWRNSGGGGGRGGDESKLAKDSQMGFMKQTIKKYEGQVLELGQTLLTLQDGQSTADEIAREDAKSK